MILLGGLRNEFDDLVRAQMAANPALTLRDFVHVTSMEQILGLELKRGRDEVIAVSGDLRHYLATRWR